ncbi:MAG TPA: hypothetical protein VH054_13950 [Polyangiaceae bacterium]|nr:hypothetical protein [Polyangiaceae bacterium]
MDDWVLLRRYDDGLAAQIALDFLRDHGVPVSVRGNSGSMAVLNRFDTVLDVRLVVRQRHLESALEALSALETPGAPIEAREELLPISGHPYRDVQNALEIPQRYRRAAFALALMMPIGSGHFYAGENVAGVVFASAIAACVVSAHAVAAVFVVACDALTSLSAVERHNAGKPASRSAQALRALACVAVAVMAASLVR